MKLIKKISTAVMLLAAINLCSCAGIVEKFYPDDTAETTRPIFVPVDVEDGNVYFKDFDGNEITLKEAPERVVSLSVISTEILCGIGAARRIVAINESSAKIDGAPLSAEILPDFYGDTEKLSKLAPQIVFYDNTVSSLTVAILKNAGMTLVRIPDKGDIATAESNVRFISSIMFKDEEGEDVIKEMRDEFKKMQVIADLIGFKKRVYIEDGITYNAYGGNSIVSELCAYAGAENVFADFKGNHLTNAEELKIKNPEAIIVLCTDPETFSAETVTKREGIQDVNAVRMKAVYAIDIKTATRPTQNITKALKSIGEVLKVTK